MGAYIVKLEREELNRDDSKMLNLILHSIGDLERISDHAKNISETAAEMDRKGAVFSQDAQNEVQVYMDAVREIVQMATDAFSRQDAALASNVEPLEEVIDTLNAEVKDRHITRLQKGTCTIELGFMLSDLSNNLERVADHCSNLAVCTIETQKDEFDMHKYLKTIKTRYRAILRKRKVSTRKNMLYRRRSPYSSAVGVRPVHRRSSHYSRASAGSVCVKKAAAKWSVMAVISCSLRAESG